MLQEFMYSDMTGVIVEYDQIPHFQLIRWCGLAATIGLCWIFLKSEAPRD